MTTVGLLGGTFDPVHIAHLQLAATVLDQRLVERVLFIPAAMPPHKKQVSITPIELRMEMVRLVVEKLPGCAVSDVEVSNDQPSYTYNTLIKLREQTSGEARFYFIVGSDAFLEIETWYRWRDLLGAADFIVAVRKGYPSHDVETLLDHYGYRRDRETNLLSRYHRPDGREICLLTADIAAISSTEIRSRVERGDPWHHLVPAEVADVIVRSRLYRSGV